MHPLHLICIMVAYIELQINHAVRIYVFLSFSILHMAQWGSLSFCNQEMFVWYGENIHYMCVQNSLDGKF